MQKHDLSHFCLVLKEKKSTRQKLPPNPKSLSTFQFGFDISNIVTFFVILMQNCDLKMSTGGNRRLTPSQWQLSNMRQLIKIPSQAGIRERQQSKATYASDHLARRKHRSILLWRFNNSFFCLLMLVGFLWTLLYWLFFWKEHWSLRHP